ncbi:PIN domain-containing protein [Pseudomonas peradeniyensis]|uniref:PIN domain-containing protein n=1 Tax=Pseudomonas peradeniyensis TaxID=2745488 RepID=UPI0021D4D8D7|nr:PIN domain-containing protein [Pseudomonas peradeniyensis]MCU7278728.1 PIN domain-containing protein [Pseudomonas peradeniyensis]
MWIVLDTNIYFGNWFADSPNFSMLLNLCNNGRHTLLLPEITAQEVNNKYLQSRDKVFNSYESSLKEFAKLKIEVPSASEQVKAVSYDIIDILRSLTGQLSLVGYNEVPHAHLIEKALKPKLPFRDGEKGYRDSLFWISVLNHIKQNNYQGEVAFLNQNSKDFFVARGRDKVFHPDLQEDIDRMEISARFLIHESIKSFIDAQGGQEAHLFDWTGFYDQHNGTLDSSVGEEAIDYLDSQPLDTIKSLLISAGYDQRMLDAAFEASFEDWDGVEDSEITNMRNIQSESGGIFIEYKFDFRMLDVKLLMTHTHYYADKHYIENNAEADISDDIVEVRLLVRADLAASIIFDPSNDYVSKVEINQVSFRKLR